MIDEKILKYFDLPREEYRLTPYGSGHINDTFLATGRDKRYILQRINNGIFPDVDGLMRNVGAVCAHSYKKVKSENGDTSRLLVPVKTTEGKLYTFYDGNYYRVYNFIENTIALNMPDSADHFGKGAKCFAEFMKTLMDFDASALTDVIPGFHDTSARVRKFKTVVEADAFGRKAETEALIDFVLERESAAGKIVDALNCGKMPLRVTHNDTKFNNLLFDAVTRDPVSVIDLDTIMKGSVLYDFGDAVRTGCNTAEEDEHDLELVKFSLPYYNAFEKGYTEVLGDMLTDEENKNFAFSAMLMTYECGVRFLCDYLEGDVYFKTHYDKQNLFRAKTQFKLVGEMEKQFGKMVK